MGYITGIHSAFPTQPHKKHRSLALEGNLGYLAQPPSQIRIPAFFVTPQAGDKFQI